jgi:hypothetical protein
MSSLDWGSVPAWLGLGTLLVTLRVFLRDRANTQRSQVDLVGVWGTPAWRRKMPDSESMVRAGEVEIFIKNANPVPIKIAYLAMDLRTRWFVPDPDHVNQEPAPDPTTPGEIWTPKAFAWAATPGTGSLRQFLGNILVPPGELFSSKSGFDVGHLAPPGATQLDLFEGVEVVVAWMLVLDNAGRRWEVRPGVGERARRIRWYSWRRRDYPYAWKNQFVMALLVRYYKIAAWLKKKRQSKRKQP